MQRRLRQLFTSVKEHGCVSYAKIATIGGFCDLDLMIVKATSPQDLPLEERYIHELVKVFTVSPSSFRAFSLSFTRRFGRTRCWRVALKCLILLHRLLRSLPENSPFRAEFLWIRANGLLSLYPCRFQDSSSLSPADYTVFVRSYAHLLDEALDFISVDLNSTGNGLDDKNYVDEDYVSTTLEGKMKRAILLELLPQLQSMIDRAIDCRPTDVVVRSFLIQSAMRNIIRDSFSCYTFFRKDVVVILDNLVQMPYRESMAAFGIYKKAAVQATQLGKFYDWCKSFGLCGSYEYPFVDRIPNIQIRALENFLDGMWQLTDTSSSSDNSPAELSKTSTGDNSGKQTVKTETVLWAELEPPRNAKTSPEMEPLIQFGEDDDNATSWEALLEASITSCATSGNDFFNPNWNCLYGDGHESNQEETNEWKLQVYDARAVNKHYEPENTALQRPVPSDNPLYPWGI